jgi:hypothetical protein
LMVRVVSVWASGNPSAGSSLEVHAVAHNFHVRCTRLSDLLPARYCLS